MQLDIISAVDLPFLPTSNSNSISNSTHPHPRGLMPIIRAQPTNISILTALLDFVTCLNAFPMTGFLIWVSWRSLNKPTLPSEPDLVVLDQGACLEP
jgi:hypothetical protein